MHVLSPSNPRSDKLELPPNGKAIQVDVLFSYQDPSRMAIVEHQAMLGWTSLISGENCIVVATVFDFDFENFRGSANLTWPGKNTVILTHLDDPNLSCVVVGTAHGEGLPVFEVSNVVYQNLPSQSVASRSSRGGSKDQQST